VQPEQDDCSVELPADDSPLADSVSLPDGCSVALAQADLVPVHVRLRQVESRADFPAGSPAE
jgi:hypothetical protein